jgi:hypothetical protein
MKDQRKVYELPAEPEKSAILRRGHELIPITLADAEIMRASCDAKKLRDPIKVRTKDHAEVQSLPLYVQFHDDNVPGSNFSLRMSPPIPVRKGILKKSENGRRHKTKTYRKPGNSAYDALLSSGNFVPGRELGYSGIHTHRHKTRDGRPSSGCLACMLHAYKYARRHTENQKIKIDEKKADADLADYIKNGEMEVSFFSLPLPPPDIASLVRKESLEHWDQIKDKDFNWLIRSTY